MACSGVGETSTSLIKGKKFLPQDVLLEMISYLFQWHVKGMRCVCAFWKEQIPLKQWVVVRGHAYAAVGDQCFSINNRLGRTLGHFIRLHIPPPVGPISSKKSDFSCLRESSLHLDDRPILVAQDRGKVCCALEKASRLQFSSYVPQEGWEKPTTTFLDLTMKVTALALKHPGLVMVGSLQCGKGMVDVYSEGEEQSKKIKPSKEHGEEIKFISFLKPEHIVSVSDHQIKVWEMGAEKSLWKRTEEVFVALVDRNCIYIANSASLKIWSNGREDSCREMSTSNPITCMDFGDDCLITGHALGGVHFRNSYTGISLFFYSSSPVHSLFFTPLGYLYVVVADEKYEAVSPCLRADILTCF